MRNVQTTESDNRNSSMQPYRRQHPSIEGRAKEKEEDYKDNVTTEVYDFEKHLQITQAHADLLGP